MDLVEEFYKKIGLYDEQLFKKIKNNTKVIDLPYEELVDFVGVYPNDKLVSYNLLLPKIENIYDVLIWVHEYAHVIFGESEDIPSVMEALFINEYIDDKELKKEIIVNTNKEIRCSTSEDHRNAKIMKLNLIR